MGTINQKLIKIIQLKDKRSITEHKYQPSVSIQGIKWEYDTENTNNGFENKNEHQVAIKKAVEYIYVRQDKSKGELKSKDWVGKTLY